MKIAVAIQNDQLGGHFAETEHFAVFTTTSSSCEVPEYRTPVRKVAEEDHHSHVDILEVLQGCDVVIAFGMGHRVANDLASAGIEPVISAETGNPAELVEKFTRGTLQRGVVHRCCHS